MLIVTNNPNDIHLPPDLPIIPSIYRLVTGEDPIRLGYYGPEWKDTYTYSSIPLDLSHLSYDPIYVPPMGTYLLSELITEMDRGSTMWVEGGGWGRIYLNVRARQADGVICPTHFHEYRDELIRIFTRRVPNSQIYRPEELWDCGGVPPDLLIKLDGYTFEESISDVLWRCGISWVVQ